MRRSELKAIVPVPKPGLFRRAAHRFIIDPKLHRSAGIAGLGAGIFLDARRAVWLERERILLVADLHLGYAWAHRHAGQMLPLSAREDSIERLTALVEEYAPVALAILGDIVHRAVPVRTLEEELRRLCDELGGRVEVRLLAGNHDATLAALLRRCGISATLHSSLEAGPHLLLHGDGKDAGAAQTQLQRAQETEGRIFMGHEHPAIRVGDGITSIKRPCFLISAEVIILPAFSNWAGGANVRNGGFLSALAGSVRFHTAHAILADKLLPISL